MSQMYTKKNPKHSSCQTSSLFVIDTHIDHIVLETPGKIPGSPVWCRPLPLTYKYMLMGWRYHLSTDNTLVLHHGVQFPWHPTCSYNLLVYLEEAIYMSFPAFTPPPNEPLFLHISSLLIISTSLAQTTTPYMTYLHPSIRWQSPQIDINPLQCQRQNSQCSQFEPSCLCAQCRCTMMYV